MLAAQAANAQTMQFPAGTYAGYDHIQRIIANTPGVSTIAVGQGVSASASGAVTVSTNGLKIPVPTAVTATIPKSAIARASSAVLRKIPYLGYAAIGYDIYSAIKNSGVTVCPASQGFFCTPITTSATAYFYWTGDSGTQFSDPESACKNRMTSSIFDYVTNQKDISTTSAQIDCMGHTTTNSTVTLITRAYRYSSTCTAGYSYNYTTHACVPTDVVALSDTELEQTLQQKMDADYTLNKKLYDALRADMKNKGLIVPLDTVVPADTPVSVVASPVTTPQTTTKTVTVTNPDGTTSTVTTKQQVTVTPTTTGSTVGDTVVNYTPQTTTTTTTTNNSTNQTTTSTSVVNSPVAQPTTDLKLPDDYNREATQKSILTELQAPESVLPADQEVRQQTEIAKTDGLIDGIFKGLTAQQTSDKSNWFSWVWTPPFAACSPFAGTVRGNSISWDLCPWIEKIREAIGFMFAIYGAIYIYGLIFRGE